jgi:diaminohydroxyphosphoribosylaminopyrimidine deaminase/5-amino-6-(5-phosphoribosylamino)uracil reductase
MPFSAVFMQRCLELASNGRGAVSPNPLVGAVLVHDGKIIGEGWHRQYGKPHAEVNAIKDCIKNGNEELLSKATFYVNLEPCNHTGKTPPCTDLILRYKIPEVIVGMKDLNAIVNGSGITRLREAGVMVMENVLAEDCVKLNKRFITYHKKKRPYIILKYAQSKDGFIAPEHSDGTIHWLSNTASRFLVHTWRSQEDAVLAGFNTVLRDNPRLTVRTGAGRNPVRITIDKYLQIPTTHHIFDGEAPTLIFNSQKSEKRQGIEYIQYNPGESLPQQVCSALNQRNIQSLILEGGLKLANEFIRESCWDEARIFTSPVMLHKGIAAPAVSGELTGRDFIRDDELCVVVNNSAI